MRGGRGKGTAAVRPGRDTPERCRGYRRRRGGDPGRLPLRPGEPIPRGTRRAAGDSRGGGGTAEAPAQGPTAPAPRRQPQLLPPGSARGCGSASSPPRYAQRHIDAFSALFFGGGWAISSRFLPESSRNATWRTPAGQRQRPLPKYTTRGDSAAHPLHPPTCAGAHGAQEGPRPPPLPPPVTAPPRATPSPPAAAQPAAGQPRSAPPAGAAHPQPSRGAARLGGHLGKCRQLRTRGLHPPLCVAAAGWWGKAPAPPLLRARRLQPSPSTGTNFPTSSARPTACSHLLARQLSIQPRYALRGSSSSAFSCPTRARFVWCPSEADWRTGALACPQNAQGMTMEMFALFFGAAETPGSAASHRCLAPSLVIQEGKVALSGAGELSLILHV